MMTKYLKLSLLLIPSITVVVLGFNNCARYGQLEEGSTSEASLGGGANDNGSLPGTDNSGSGDEINSEKLGISIALLSAEQTLSSMMKVANVSVPSTALRNEYNTRYGSLAPGNDLSLANAPLMLGATSLGGEVCNSLLTQEKALADTARNYFGSINFAAGVTSVTDAGFQSSVRGMARSFWGRNETMEELTLLSQFKMDFINALAATARTQAASTNNLMLATCSAMLSSVDAITY